jgi:flagellin-specific chaperone FliS
MLAQRNPSEAYRRIDFDARVEGANPRQLVSLCYEQLISALGSAIFAYEQGDNRMKSQALTRTLATLTALQMGVSGQGGVAAALHQLYEAARCSVLDSVLSFDPKVIATIRQDFIDIARAMAQSSPSPASPAQNSTAASH